MALAPCTGNALKVQTIPNVMETWNIVPLKLVMLLMEVHCRRMPLIRNTITIIFKLATDGTVGAAPALLGIY